MFLYSSHWAFWLLLSTSDSDLLKATSPTNQHLLILSRRLLKTGNLVADFSTCGTSRVLFFQVDHIPNMVTSLAFGAGGDVITGDSSGRIFVWSKDSTDAFVVDRMASESMRHAHEVLQCQCHCQCQCQSWILLRGRITEHVYCAELVRLISRKQFRIN